jgi:hypothetical protein
VNLSYGRQVDILSRLANLADRAEELSVQLQKAGFDSFVAYQSFLASFCEQTEKSGHQRYLIEVAKTEIGTPDRVSGFLAGRELGFRSPLLAAMRAERDRTNGVTFEALTGPDIWKREIDPCARRMKRLEFSADPVVAERRRQMNLDRSRRREAEIAQHASERGQSFTFDSTGCSRFVAEVMESDLTPFEFAYDRRRSRRFFPVLSKPLTPSWDLCWSLHTDRNLRRMPRYQAMHGAWEIPLDACLYAASKGRRGNVDIPVGFTEWDAMEIAYTRLICGFEWAYGRYEGPQELETILKAHVELLKLTIPTVDSVLVSELNR